MKLKTALTVEQKELVEQHLPLVLLVIRKYINTNENVLGLGFDDLYQEGAVALCSAALTYDGRRAKFKTYADKVVRNHLLDHCRRISARIRNLPSCSLDSTKDEDRPPTSLDAQLAYDDTGQWLSRIYTSQLLERSKRAYHGSVRLGIEAIELMMEGLSREDIAALYRTTPKNVSAWVYRAREKLKRDQRILELYPQHMEQKSA